jgi:hypothetical protein
MRACGPHGQNIVTSGRTWPTEAFIACAHMADGGVFGRARMAGGAFLGLGARMVTDGRCVKSRWGAGVALRVVRSR